MLYLTRYLPNLIDPLTGADLAMRENGLAPLNQAEAVYGFQDDILRLIPPDWDDPSAAYDAACSHLTPPDEISFKCLPNHPIEGWGDSYWQQRALSMAGIWDILEAERRASGRYCVGYQGVAAHLTHSLPYVAYGLDVGGYKTYALSPHTGQYSLGVYRYGRYCRIQTDWQHLPLRAGRFDVIVITGVLDEISPAQAQDLLQQVIGCLAPRGYLLISDVANSPQFVPILAENGLQTELIPLAEVGLKHTLRVWLKQDTPMPPLLAGRK